MPAQNISNLQFRHTPGPYHIVRAYQGKKEVAGCPGTPAASRLSTPSLLPSQGVATALYGEAHG